MSADGFSRRFAICMPNGALYQPKPTPAVNVADDYSMASPMRDLYAMFMGSGPTAQEKPPAHGPEIYDTRDQAEAKLKELRQMAEKVGVTLWGGVVVEQLCTPFTSGDAATEFADQVVSWIDEQGGER
jgi:hypothetical protein